MSAKIFKKGDKEKSFENVQRKIQCQNTAKNPLIFHNVSKPSPQLTDESEFPSLNELSGKATCNSQSSRRNLKYSDKLKSYTTQNTTSNYFHFKHDFVPTNFQEGNNQTIPSPQVKNKWFHNGNKSNEKLAFQVNKQTEAEESNIVKEKAVNNYASQNKPKFHSSHSFTESLSLKRADKKNQPFIQKHTAANTSNSTPDKTSNRSPNCASTSSKLNCQVQSGNEIKLVLEKTTIKDKNDASDNVATKKKKKRKSKVKRQVALQTGKITVLTPEVHSKILNQTSVLTSQNFKSVFTDINDEEEYPELGKSLIPSSQKENYPKKESNSCETSQDECSVIKTVNKSTETSVTFVEKQLMTKDVAKESAPLSLLKSEDKSALEKKVKSDNKAIHPNDPITVSFFDILVNKNCKTKAKDFKAEIDPPLNPGFTKIKVKKNACHPHNLLDSSSPAVKRGKEREKPKPKKPSQLKKIILLDRKVRREHLLQLKGTNIEEGDKSEQEVDEFESNEANNEEKILLEDCCENSLTNLHSFEQAVSEENSSVPCDNNDDNLILFDDNIVDLNDIHNSTVSEICNYEEFSKCIPLCTAFSPDIKSQSTEEIVDILDNVSKKEKGESERAEITKDCRLADKVHLSGSKSPDSSLNSLINEERQPDSVDKEKAVKVLLHTRNFREYCNHLISVDIDDVVYALLDDLARFQDRLHQKDPVKARMKRRMIYGVKEVKKHIKLKKLKCIVVAADIENIETHGGLNDLLNDIKSSAADHHIPCIFALSRKTLGKVCRKPVPVSCVGVFNFEGSEANFKKMVELQTQSKIDYAEISSKLSQSITDDQIVSLLKAKIEAPETLRAIRTNILGDFFLEPRTEVAESDKNIEPTEKVSEDFSDTED